MKNNSQMIVGFFVLALCIKQGLDLDSFKILMEAVNNLGILPMMIHKDDRKGHE